MTKFARSIWSVVLVAAIAATMACSSSSTSSGGGGSQTIDLAVADRDYNGGSDDYQVMLWFDVLTNVGPALPEPNITLSTENRSPVSANFYNGDLYVAATDNGSASEGGVLIYRDYLNLADGATPDAVLTGTSIVTGPGAAQRLALENNILASSTWYEPAGAGSGDAAYVWGDASELTDGAVPDAVLNETTTGLVVGTFGEPTDVVLLNGRLFVANNGAANTTVVALAIWNDVTDLVANGPTAPDEVLFADPNLLNLGQTSKHITIANNTLYLSGESGGAAGNAPFIFIFEDAANVSGSSLPSNVIVGCVDSSAENGCYVESPGQMSVENNVLWVANKNENNTPNTNPAVAGFFPADGLAQNQLPTLSVSGGLAPAQAERVVALGGALFVTGSPDNSDGWDRKGIYIYRNASAIVSGATADLSAVGDDNDDLAFMKFPTGIGATVRGTFDDPTF